MEKKHEDYDVVIIGGGAAGLTAAIYAGRARLKTLLIEKSLLGGLATYTSDIVNYPGFPEGETGTGLMKLFEKQAKNFGVKIKLTDVKSVTFKDGEKLVETFRNVFHAKSVIIASGGKPRLTGAENEEKYLYDKGISFCATCDAAQYTDKTVMVIGSGDAAIEEGMFLTKFAKKVIVSVIHDEGIMDANEIARDSALANPKMEFKWNTMVNSFEGDERLEKVVLKNMKKGDLDPIEVDGCFLFIGYVPNTEIFEGQIDMSKRKYVITNERMETNVQGVFAAGDVRDKELRQVATAVGDGAIAGVAAEKFIADTEVFHQQLMQKEKVGLIYVYNAVNAIERDVLIRMQQIEQKMNGQVKLNVVDVYKGDCLCRMIGSDVEAPSVVYTKDGKIVEKSTDISEETVLNKLKGLIG